MTTTPDPHLALPCYSALRHVSDWRHSELIGGIVCAKLSGVQDLFLDDGQRGWDT